MKNSMCYFCSVLFLFLIWGSNASAQESTSSMHFSLFGGLALPQGDFGSTSISNDNEKSGFASTGFCAMVEGSKNLNQNVKWVSSLSLVLNSLDEKALQSEAYYSGVEVTAGNYLTTWAMTGIGYETAISPTINIYGVGQIGLLISSFPDVTISYSSSQTEATTTKIGTSFAYGFGAGIVISKINIGLRYYSGEPEYEHTTDYTYPSGTGTDSKKVKMPATVLQLMVGITL